MPWAVDDYHFADTSLNSCSWITGLCADGSVSSLCTVSRVKTWCCSVMKYHLRAQSMAQTLLSLFWSSRAANTDLCSCSSYTLVQESRELPGENRD